MSKIFQVLDDICHWDATYLHPTSESIDGLYAPDIKFVEAPDNVQEGWGYDETAEGDARFIEPTPPQGWLYHRETGTFYPNPNYIPAKPDHDPAEVEHT